MSADPNVFLVGAPKCGTTAMSAWLAARDDVFLPYPKEPWFWADDFKRTGAVVKLPGLADYLALFAGADPAKHAVRLDGSTVYLMSDRAIPRILEHDPEAKFIVMLRRPDLMAEAYHMEQVFNHVEDVADFETAWGMQAARAGGRDLPPLAAEPFFLQYAQVAALGSQLERAMSRIAPDRLLVVFQEDIAEDARREYLRVLDFLGLPDDGRTEFPKVGAAHANRFPALSRLYQRPPAAIAPVVRGMKRFLYTTLPPERLAAVKGLVSKKQARPPLREEFRAALREALRPEAEKVKAAYGRVPAAWEL